MPSSGEVANILSKVTLQRLGSVNAIGQALRGHGLLSKSGRGRSAAEMSVTDITNWTLAILGTDTISAAPRMVEFLRPLPFNESLSEPIPKALSDHFSFWKHDKAGDAIEALLLDIRKGVLDTEPPINVKLHVVRSGEIGIDITWPRSNPETGANISASLLFARGLGPEAVARDMAEDLPPGIGDDVQYVSIIRKRGLWKLAGLFPART